MLKKAKYGLLILLAVLFVVFAIDCDPPVDQPHRSSQSDSQPLADERGEQTEHKPDGAAPPQPNAEPSEAEQTPETPAGLAVPTEAAKKHPASNAQQSPTSPSGNAQKENPNPAGNGQTPPPAQNESQKQIATLSIVADQERGTVLAPTRVEVKEGETVLDLLKRLTRNNKIQLEYSGFGATAYVEGIDNLYEFDRGGKSGWMYRVNGKFPDKSAGAYPVASGDLIEWLYTLDLGKDLGAEFK